jgi:hypothetical protein
MRRAKRGWVVGAAVAVTAMMWSASVAAAEAQVVPAYEGGDYGHAAGYENKDPFKPAFSMHERPGFDSVVFYTGKE